MKNDKGVVTQVRDYSINFLVLAAKDTTLPFVISFKLNSGLVVAVV